MTYSIKNWAIICRFSLFLFLVFHINVTSLELPTDTLSASLRNTENIPYDTLSDSPEFVFSSKTITMKSTHLNIVSDSLLQGNFSLSFSEDYSDEMLFLKDATALCIKKNEKYILNSFHCDSISKLSRFSETFDILNDTLNFIFGRFDMSVPIKEIHVEYKAKNLLILSDVVLIKDDSGKLIPIALENTDKSTIILNDFMDSKKSPAFNTVKDSFLISTVVNNNGTNSAFSLLCPIVHFNVQHSDTTITYNLVATSYDSLKGPTFIANIINPLYDEKEFTLRCPLKKPVTLTDKQSSKMRITDWETINDKNELVLSDSTSSVTYMGWQLHLKKISITPNGIELNDFDIAIPQPFSLKTSGTNHSRFFIPGFSGARIIASNNFPEQLIIGDTAKAQVAKNFCIPTNRGYSVSAIKSITFVPDSKRSSYNLNLIHTGILSLPSKNNGVFNEDSAVTVSIDTLVMSSHNILRLRAHGKINRTFGNLLPNCTDSIKPTLSLHGILTVRYLARDFQLYVTSDSGKALFSIPSGVFDNDTSISLPKGSIGLFSDMTINTLYINADFGKQFIINPSNFANKISFKVPGMDVMITENGLRYMLHAPKIAFLTDSNHIENNPYYYDIDQVMLDKNNSIIAVNGLLRIGEKEPDPLKYIAPAYITKAFKFKSEFIRIGTEHNPQDSSLNLVVSDYQKTLEFGDIFQPLGIKGIRFFPNELKIVAHDDNNWQLKQLKGSTQRMFAEYCYISKDAISKNMTPDTLQKNDEILFANLCVGGGMDISFDSIQQEILVSLKYVDITLTEKFPNEIFRKLRPCQDLVLGVREGWDYPRIVSITPKELTFDSLSKCNVKFVNANITFGFDSTNSSMNTSKSNYCLTFSFSNVIKDGESLLPYRPKKGQYCLNVFLDGSYEILNQLSSRKKRHLYRFINDNISCFSQ